MKKFYLLPLMLMAVLFTACSDKEDSYKNVIPQDAKALMRIDVKSSLETTGQSFDEFVKEFDKGLESAGVDGLSYEKLGIDMEAPSYGFATGTYPNITFGFVVKVKDRESLEKIFDDKLNAKSKKDKRDDFSIYELDDDEAYCGISEEAFLLLASPEKNKELKSTLCKYLKAEDNDIEENALFKRIEEKGAPFSIYAQSNLVSNDMLSMGIKATGLDFTADELASITIGGDMQQKGRIIDFNVWYEASNSSMQKKLDTYTKGLGVPNDKGLELLTGQEVFAGVANISGEEISNTIETIMSTVKGVSSSDREQAREFEALLNLFAGNVVGGLFGDFDEGPDGFIAAKSGDTSEKIYEYVQSEVEPYDWDEDGEYTKTYEKDGNSYIITSAYGSKEVIGYENGFSFFGNVKPVFRSSNQMPSELVSMIKNNRVTFFMNLKALSELILDEAPRMTRGQLEEAFDKTLKEVDYFTITLK